MSYLHKMRWSFHIARVAGIDVKIHVTFLLLLAFTALSSGEAGGMPAAVHGVLFVCTTFLCVLLHEFGHALAARRYGVRTPDITLLPIGGVARLDRMPEKPSQEIAVAVAGPLVNVAIGLALWLAMGMPGLHTLEMRGIAHGHFFAKLLLVNVTLVLFNLVPAFPMDGGRVVRALLAMRMNYSRATRIAATGGQALAFAFGTFGFVEGNFIWVLIATFVYVAASREAAFTAAEELSNEVQVGAAMSTDFISFPGTATLAEAGETLVRTGQAAFPVVDADEKLVGLLTREEIISRLHRGEHATKLSSAVRQHAPGVHLSMRLSRARAVMAEWNCPCLPVVDSAGMLVGLCSMADLLEVSVNAGTWRGASRSAPQAA